MHTSTLSGSNDGDLLSLIYFMRYAGPYGVTCGVIDRISTVMKDETVPVDYG